MEILEYETVYSGALERAYVRSQQRRPTDDERAERPKVNAAAPAQAIPLSTTTARREVATANPVADYLRARDRWFTSAEICKALGMRAADVYAALTYWRRRGKICREIEGREQGRIEGRIQRYRWVR